MPLYVAAVYVFVATGLKYATLTCFPDAPPAVPVEASGPLFVVPLDELQAASAPLAIRRAEATAALHG
jgi:hypothetical protein